MQIEAKPVEAVKGKKDEGPKYELLRQIPITADVIVSAGIGSIGGPYLNLPAAARRCCLAY